MFGEDDFVDGIDELSVGWFVVVKVYCVWIDYFDVVDCFFGEGVVVSGIF